MNLVNIVKIVSLLHGTQIRDRKMEQGGQHSNPGEMMVAWARIVAKKIEADRFEMFPEETGQDLPVNWS